MNNNENKTIWYDSPYKKHTDKKLWEKYNSLDPETSEKDYREQTYILKELGDRYLNKLNKKYKLKS